MLIGAGCVKKIETSYNWIGGIGTGMNYRRAVEHGIPNKIEVEEYSNYSASLRFLAGAMGIPYLPTYSLLGSDIPKYNKQIKITENPYNSGEKLALVPAAQPDVAFIHVQRADINGNAQVYGCTTNCMNQARAAKYTVLLCEEIIPTSEIRKNPNLTLIPQYCVDAVVHVPFGAHPFPVAGYYWIDLPFRRDFVRENATQEGFEKWLDEWVFDTGSLEAYLDKVGRERLSKLAKMETDNYKIPG
jgi:glutaconate CoA-transferase subunit A